jgi:hypothetical protein
MVALFTSATVAQNGASPRELERKPVRVLLVVAHPDDEYEVAGTVYRISKELFGTVDQVIITDGEAGYRYSSLAVPYYGIDLTNEAVGLGGSNIGSDNLAGIVDRAGLRGDRARH